MANALNVVEGFDLKSMPKHGVETLHRMIDGMNMGEILFEEREKGHLVRVSKFVLCSVCHHQHD